MTTRRVSEKNTKLFSLSAIKKTHFILCFFRHISKKVMYDGTREERGWRIAYDARQNYIVLNTKKKAKKSQTHLQLPGAYLKRKSAYEQLPLPATVFGRLFLLRSAFYIISPPPYIKSSCIVNLVRSSRMTDAKLPPSIRTAWVHMYSLTLLVLFSSFVITTLQCWLRGIMEKHPKEVSEKKSSSEREESREVPMEKLSFSFLLLFWIWSDSEDSFRFFVFVHTLFQQQKIIRFEHLHEGVGATINGLRAHCMLCLGRMSIAHTLSQYDFAFSSLFSSHIEEWALQMKWNEEKKLKTNECWLHRTREWEERWN